MQRNLPSWRSLCSFWPFARETWRRHNRDIWFLLKCNFSRCSVLSLLEYIKHLKLDIKVLNWMAADIYEYLRVVKNILDFLKFIINCAKTSVVF